MKAFFVIGDLSAYGGTERVTTEMAAAFADAGHEVSILSLFGPAEPWFDIPEGVEVKSAGLEPASGNIRRAAAISRCLKSEAHLSGVSAVPSCRVNRCETSRDWRLRA